MFKDIAAERQEKLLTLHTDCIEQEWRKFLSAAQVLPLAAGDVPHFEAVYATARAQHYGDRIVDRYYVTHPIRVARFLAVWCGDRVDKVREPLTSVLTAALLHNVLEKQVMSVAYLTDHYGKSVSDAVSLITPDRPAMQTSQGKEEYYAALAQAPLWVQALKVFDKVDNLFVLCINPSDSVRKEYLDEIETHLMPVVQRTMPWHVPYVQALVMDNRSIGFCQPLAESLK